MAGAGYKLFNTGDVLTAAQVNTYLQEQVVMVFASAAARTTALSGVLAEGMVTYLKDTDALEIYSGSAWVGYGSGDITGVTAGTGISGGGTSGTVTITNSMATAIDAKGDLVAGTGSDTFARLAVGTNGQVLTADSTASTGLKWATAGGGDWIKITTSTATSVNSHSISSCFSSTYKVYKIFFQGTATAGEIINVRFRVGSTDTTTNYEYQFMQSAGGTFGGAGNNSATFIQVSSLQTTLGGFDLTVYDPNASGYTPIHCSSSDIGGYVRIWAGGHKANTSFDGITFYTNFGNNFSGTFYVYGLVA